MLRQLSVMFFGPVRNNLARSCSKATTSTEESAYKKNSVTKEEQLTETLKKEIPGITYISVEDISGGCGAMYEINIEAKEFVGISTVKQHRLVTETLKSEIAAMHGIRIHTRPSVPASDPLPKS